MQLVVQTEITCPHCGEVFPLQIDTSESEQSLIEDCSVCCRPINLTVRCQAGAVVDLAIVRV
jgi:phage terminase large subunit GpA-like protein